MLIPWKMTMYKCRRIPLQSLLRGFMDEEKLPAKLEPHCVVRTGLKSLGKHQSQELQARSGGRAHIQVGTKTGGNRSSIQLQERRQQQWINKILRDSMRENS